MYNPDKVVNAVVDALRSIPQLVTAMAGDESRIFGFFYLYGQDTSLKKSIYELQPPRIQVANVGVMGGNYSGETMTKHRIEIIVKMQNVQTQQGNPISYGDIWTIFTNYPVFGSTTSIRGWNLLPNLDIPDVPSQDMIQDADSINMMRIMLVIPEVGDIQDMEIQLNT
jgi:hypothetical protein